MTALASGWACLAAGVVLACVVSPGAHGAAYPTKPIRFIVGPAPLSGTDTVARVVAQRLTDRLGQTVIVDNRPWRRTTCGNWLRLPARIRVN